MEVFVEHVNGVQFKIETREHSIYSDQPVEFGGKNTGMTPPELLLAALGSCAGYYAAAYLKKRNLEQKGTRVRVTAEKAKNPARLDNFRIEVQVPVDLTEEQREEVCRDPADLAALGPEPFGTPVPGAGRFAHSHVRRDGGSGFHAGQRSIAWGRRT